MSYVLEVQMVRKFIEFAKENHTFRRKASMIRTISFKEVNKLALQYSLINPDFQITTYDELYYLAEAFDGTVYGGFFTGDIQITGHTYKNVIKTDGLLTELSAHGLPSIPRKLMSRQTVKEANTLVKWGIACKGKMEEGGVGYYLNR
ncbi:MAG: hypothetical protein AAFO96_03465 [Bacteroidota bacterium]